GAESATDVADQVHAVGRLERDTGIAGQIVGREFRADTGVAGGQFDVEPAVARADIELPAWIELDRVVEVQREAVHRRAVGKAWRACGRCTRLEIDTRARRIDRVP